LISLGVLVPPAAGLAVQASSSAKGMQAEAVPISEHQRV